MKRILAGLALTTAAALVTAAPAHAAPADPVKALKKQFVAGKGVRIVETARLAVDGKKSSSSKSSGTFLFGKSGVVASDLKNQAPKAAAQVAPPRVITIGGHSYVQGGAFSQDLPEGKKWVRYPGVAAGATYSQMIDVFQPGVLKVLVAKATSVKGGTYKGALTQDQLAAASHGQKLGGKLGKIKIEYALSVNSKGLVRELRSNWTMDFGVLGKYRSSTSTQYIGWGSKVTIKAPAEDLWIDAKDLGEDSEVPDQLAESSIGAITG
ncbi:hypothetical protein ACGFJC_17370 [Nonomuraea fuscirosea]|uniref:hypothetical protein n=1 Tax=Nonomuraea fuscirosea TaxID=1291556 RepID=UPI00344215AA